MRTTHLRHALVFIASAALLWSSSALANGVLQYRFEGTVQTKKKLFADGSALGRYTLYDGCTGAPLSSAENVTLLNDDQDSGNKRGEVSFNVDLQFDDATTRALLMPCGLVLEAELCCPGGIDDKSRGVVCAGDSGSRRGPASCTFADDAVVLTVEPVATILDEAIAPILGFNAMCEPGTALMSLSLDTGTWRCTGDLATQAELDAEASARMDGDRSLAVMMATGDALSVQTAANYTDAAVAPLQQRVSGNCAVGSAIREIAADGSVACDAGSGAADLPDCPDGHFLMSDGGEYVCRAYCNGVWRDLSGDVNDCGSCGNTCNLPRATPACEAGLCVIGTCDAGYTDCNGQDSDGCEVRTAFDAGNCGGCGITCGAGEGCDDGTCRPSNFIGSSLINPSQGNQINAWAGSPGQDWTACYVRSRDGASSSTFHSYCDGLGQSVMVMELSNGKVIGGYASVSWNTNNNYFGNNSSFLFSLTNDFKHSHYRYNHYMYGNNSYGPTWGGGHDLHVDGNISSGYANLGHNYQCRVGSYGSSQCRDDFAGSYNGWNIVELEVWVQPCTGSNVLCEGTCQNLDSDPDNCGVCGRECNGACVNGSCDVGQCDAGFADCNGNAFDGCEVDLSLTDAHCGACGNACSGGTPYCFESACTDIRPGCAAHVPFTHEVTPGLWACATDHLIDTYSENDAMCGPGSTPATYNNVQGLRKPSLAEHLVFRDWYNSVNSNNGSYIRTGQKRRGGCTPEAHGDVYVPAHTNGDGNYGQTDGGWHDLFDGGASCNKSTWAANNMSHRLAGVICVQGVYELPSP